MIQKENFEHRLKELDWTLYRLAREFAEYRAAGQDVSAASRYHSSISKAIENPSKSKLETIEDVVKVLNGKLTILWEPGKLVTIRLEDETIEAIAEKYNVSVADLMTINGFEPRDILIPNQRVFVD